MGEFDLSLSDYQHSLTLNSQDVESLLGCAQSHIKLNNYETAMAFCMNAIDISPTDMCAFKTLALACHMMGSYSREWQVCDKILQLRQLPMDFFGRGIACFSLGSYKEAISDFDESIRRGYNHFYAYHLRGSALRRLEQRDHGIEDLTTAILLNSNYSNSYAERGVAYTHFDQYSKALFDFSEAVRMSPDNPHYYRMRAMCLVRLNEYSLAIHDYKRAIDLNIQDAKIHEELKVAYSHLNRESVCSLNQIESEIIDKLKKLNEIEIQFRQFVSQSETPLGSEQQRDFLSKILQIGYDAFCLKNDAVLYFADHDTKILREYDTNLRPVMDKLKGNRKFGSISAYELLVKLLNVTEEGYGSVSSMESVCREMDKIRENLKKMAQYTY